MDEYGEFIDDDDDDRQSTTTLTPSAVADDEPELPGLTDEAKRLLEVAREELESGEQPHTALCRWRSRDS